MLMLIFSPSADPNAVRIKKAKKAPATPSTTTGGVADTEEVRVVIVWCDLWVDLDKHI